VSQRKPRKPLRLGEADVEFMTERPMPHSVEAERAYLGAIILDNSLIIEAAGQLKPDDFYVRAHYHLFRAMLAMGDAGQEINPILVGEWLRQDGSLEQVGGIAFISELTYGLPHFSNIAHYAKVIRDASLLRQGVKVANKMASLCLDQEDEAEVIVQSCEEMVLALVNEMWRGNNAKVREGFYTLAQLTPEFRQRIEAYHRYETKAITTGMREVDEMLDGGGLQPQGLYYVGAAPKSGKTSLALGWAYYVASVLGKTVLAISEEMHRLQLMQRLYSAHTGVPYFMFRPGFYGAEYERALTSLADFGKLPIKVTDNLRTIPQIRRHCGREVQGAKPGQEVGLIIVDYLQLVGLSDHTADWKHRAQEVGAISREVKRMGQELDVPVLAMSALNRDSSREGRRPEIYDLRESGQLEFDAEAIFFLHNPAYVPGKPYQRKDVEDIDLIIAAQRNGPTGDISLKFLSKYMQFMTERDYRSVMETGHETAQVKQQAEDSSPLWVESAAKKDGDE
jgi:replicative DNA helicase